jgi:DNA-binding PadR family transcriptional regulator
LGLRRIIESGVDPRLIILGLLKKAPMHGYELQRVMKQSRVDQWAGMLKGSIYHALKRMAAEGLLKVRASDSGRGRVKSVYEVTARGRAEFKQLLRASWSSRARGFPASLFASVAFLDELPAEEVLGLLEGQQSGITEELAAWRAGERAKAGAGALPPHLRLLFDSACQHLETDLRLTESLKLLLGAYGPVGTRK